MIKLKLISIVMLSSFFVTASFADMKIMNKKNIRVMKKPEMTKQTPKHIANKNLSASIIPPEFKGSWGYYHNGRVTKDAPRNVFSHIEIKPSKKSGRGFFIMFTEKTYESTRPNTLFTKKWESPALLIKHPTHGYALKVARHHKYYANVFSNQDYMTFDYSILLTYDKARKTLVVMSKAKSITHYKNNQRTAVTDGTQFGSYLWTAEYKK